MYREDDNTLYSSSSSSQRTNPPLAHSNSSTSTGGAGNSSRSLASPAPKKPSEPLDTYTSFKNSSPTPQTRFTTRSNSPAPKYDDTPESVSFGT